MGVKGQKAWNKTNVDLIELKRLYLDDHLCAEEVAHKLSIPTSIVFRRLKELGITRTNSESQIGKTPHNLKGRFQNNDHIMVSIPPTSKYSCMGRCVNGSNRVYMYEHRYVMAKSLGRPLSKSEVVHHKNGNTLDNRIENLELFPSHSEHMKLHMTSEEARKRGQAGLESMMAVRAEVGNHD